MFLAKKKKSLMIFFSFLLGIFLLVYFLIIPLVQKVYQKKNSLEESRLVLERDRKNINEYKNNLSYLKNNSFLNEDLKINDNNRVEFIKKLEKMASEANLGMEIDSYKPRASKSRKTKEDKNTPENFLKIELEGDYQNFLVYLYRLEHFQYVIGVEEVAISNFDKSKIKNKKNLDSLENLPKIEGSIVISFS